MTPQRKIEILTLVRNGIEKYGLYFGLCQANSRLHWFGYINSRELTELKDEFMTWAKSTPYRYKDGNIYAAPPGEVQPRLDYLNKRIEELQREK